MQINSIRKPIAIQTELDNYFISIELSKELARFEKFLQWFAMVKVTAICVQGPFNWYIAFKSSIYIIWSFWIKNSFTCTKIVV